MANGHNDETVDKDSLLDRRSMLKLTGAAATGLVATGLSGTAAADRTLDISDGEVIDSYLENISDGETVQVPKGTYSFGGATISSSNWTILGQGSTFDAEGDVSLRLVGDGWTFSGVNFDVESGNVRALPDGDGWTLQNCAWNGPNSMGSPLVRPYVDSGGQATIDSCWFGDGMGTRVGESAIKSNSDGSGNYSVNGDLFVKGCYFWQNTCYAAASASPGQPGNVHFEDCYFQDAYLAAIRTGSLSGKCNVTNCVITAEDESDVPETSSGVSATRGIWAYWGEVVVEDTDIYTPGASALIASDSKDDAAITATNCEVVGGIDSSVSQSNVGSDPSRSPPSGCVTSPTEAAEGNSNSGSSGDDSTQDNPDATTHELVVEGTGTTAHYRFSVDGTLSGSGDTIEQWDDISGTTAEGWITSKGSVDRFEFTGSVTDFSFLEGSANVYVDGEQLDTGGSDGSDSTDDEETATTRKLVVEGTGETTNYRFSVDGTLSGTGGTIEEWDTIDGTTAEGWVTSTGATDEFEFTGSLTDLTFLEGSAVVTVDGEVVDPTSGGSSGDSSGSDSSGDDGTQDNTTTTHELIVSGTGTTTNYQFSVDGTLSGAGDTIEEWDTIDGTTAEGWVTSKGSVDRYEFTGSLTELTFLQGSATVTVNGTVVEPGEAWSSDDSSGSDSSGDDTEENTTTTHEMVIEGTGTTTNYQFSVDGSLAGVGDTIEQWDNIDGTSAEGWVTSQGSEDRFEFTGSVTEFSFSQGNANVYIDGNSVSPDSL